MMISSRFTRWLTLFALAATVAVALLLAQIRPLPPAGSNVVGETAFTWLKTMAVRWKRLPKI